MRENPKWWTGKRSDCSRKFIIEISIHIKTHPDESRWPIEIPEIMGTKKFRPRVQKNPAFTKEAEYEKDTLSSHPHWCIAHNVL
ncbi:MAG: hypothetical protein NPIRA06_06000 [Nitrospirales bacterium]|nr:MAG: hypothetical protein NPIRA06_06000 [Nitrospirales bacterium]